MEGEGANGGGVVNWVFGSCIRCLNPYSYGSVPRDDGDIRFRHDITSSRTAFPNTSVGGELDPWERGPPYDVVYSSDEESRKYPDVAPDRLTKLREAQNASSDRKDQNPKDGDDEALYL